MNDIHRLIDRNDPKLIEVVTECINSGHINLNLMELNDMFSYLCCHSTDPSIVATFMEEIVADLDVPSVLQAVKNPIIKQFLIDHQNVSN